MKLFNVEVETTTVEFDGVILVVPVINGKPMEFIHKTFSGYPSKCGAGQGIGDLIVPETWFGLRASAICHIHDTDFEIAPPTWMAFHALNYRFIRNSLELIRVKSANAVTRTLRNYRATTYFNAVDSIGADIFWNLKREQGYNVPSGV